MYIKMTGTEKVYRALKSLSFVPEVDLTLSSVPVCEFRAEVMTDEDIPVGAMAELRDDMDNLWAKYRVMKSERVDRQTVRLLAQSELNLMDYWTVPAEMINGVSVSSFVYDLLHGVPVSGSLYGMTIDVDSAFSGVSVTGFCPEQTARERLQWLCLAIGGLVKQCFTDRLTIIPAPLTDGSTAKGTLIPLADTYMKPSITIRDYVAELTVTGYDNFTTAEPPEGSTLVWESSEDYTGTKWYYNPVDMTFVNSEDPDEPGRTPAIDGVTLIHASDAMQTLTRLAPAYFRRGEITLEVINNAQYYPGQKVRVYTDEYTVYEGWIQSCDFTFGVQAKSRMVISSDLAHIPMGTIRINYRYGDIPIGWDERSYPADDPYDITNPDITWVDQNGRNVLKPDTPELTGDTGEGRTVIDVNYTPVRVDHITVTRLPNKLSYNDGDFIEYEGIEVTAYGTDGQVWKFTGGENGVIPREKLYFPQGFAHDPGDVILGSSSLSMGGISQPITYGNKLVALYENNDSYDQDTYSDAKFTGYWSGGNSYAYIVAMAIRTGYRVEDRTIYKDGRPDAAATEERNTNLTYTAAGKTVYYAEGIASWYAGHAYKSVSPLIGSGSYRDFDNYAGQIAWTMVFGNVISSRGDMYVPVEWKYNGITYTTGFEIHVTGQSSTQGGLEP